MEDGKNNMKNLKVLYETNHFIVIEKPVNVPSQGDKTGDTDLKEKYQKPGNVYVGLIHRLDRPVGGVMVFAKTSKAAARLSEAVRNRQIEKEYLLIADGKFENTKGIMEDFLKKDERTNLSKVVPENTADANYAKLEYEVLHYREDNDLSLVKVKLHTGRHHQIRVQFASRNHSLYGDQKYGARGNGKQIALFAYRLSFPDPITKEMLTFTAMPEANGTWSMIQEI